MTNGKSPLPPACAARYAHRKELASGGYGAVHLAVQNDLDRLVVVKLLHTQVLDDAEAVQRFQNEARISAAISSPHVAELIEAGFDGVPWIVYEYLPGRSVRSLLFDGALAPALAVKITQHVLAGLSAAHALNILHRDIKPENVLQGEGEHYKVTDFGIAKWTRDGAVKTRTGFVLGTPQYLAPEVIAGTALDARADLYATGVMLHELVTGAPPFTGDSPIVLLERHLKSTPPPLPAALAAQVPGLQRVVDRALAKDPDQRYASADEMAEALAQLACAAVETPLRKPAPPAWTAGAPTAGAAVQKLSGATRAVSRAVAAVPANSGRFRRRAAFAAAAVLVLLCGGLLWATLRPHAPHAPEELTHGTPAQRVVQLFGGLSRLERDVVAAFEAGPHEKRSRRAKLEARAQLYLGKPEPQLALLVSEIDRLAPAMCAHSDLEQVTLPFSYVAEEVAYHAAHLKRARPDAPQPGATLRGVPVWFTRALELARASANREPMEDAAPALRELLPLPNLVNATSEISLLLPERVLDWELRSRGGAYAKLANDGALDARARGAIELAVALLAWRFEHGFVATSRLEPGALANLLGALAPEPGTSRAALQRRIKAFLAIRDVLLSRSEGAVASQLAVAGNGARLLEREFDAKLAPAALQARPGDTAHDAATPYLLGLRLLLHGNDASARHLFYLAATELEKKAAERDGHLEERAEPRASYLLARLILDRLERAHQHRRNGRGTPCILHSECETVLRVADGFAPSEKEREQHRTIADKLRP